ncbi:MAG: glucosaminidase domain-containing protein [Salinivirgaceae bacterium]|jgi:LysM repeat protein|nr:glucosaminidase domain-containing protein [Salinivirgaceae bacterium]
MVKYIFISAFLFITVVSAAAQQKLSRTEYINQYKGIAIKEMKRTGVPASITMAQGILESENGNSSLAVKANNHFGIKCHNDWTGKTIRHDDDKRNECFRKYKNAELSFKDHSEFLSKHQRYAFLFAYKTTDYKSWARGLKKAGYATHPKYDKLLIRIIEENLLYTLDDRKYKPVKHQDERIEPIPELADNVDDYEINPFGNKVKTYNRIDYVIVEDGDTYESIAKEQEVMPWQIIKYNELPSGAELIPDTKIYLQPKRRKAPVGYKYHTISAGENMYIISQKYGVKLKHLYRLNNFDYGREPEIGYTLSLRKKKKKN